MQWLEKYQTYEEHQTCNSRQRFSPLQFEEYLNDLKSKQKSDQLRTAQGKKSWTLKQSPILPFVSKS